MVPEPYVVDRFRVVLNVGQRQSSITRKLPFFDLFESESLAGRCDVMCDEWGFSLLFVWGHDQPLQPNACEVAADGDQCIEPNRNKQRSVSRRDSSYCTKCSADQRHEHQKPEQRKSQRDVDIGGSVDDASRCRQGPRYVEMGPPGEQQEKACDKETEVASSSFINHRPARRVDCDLAGGEIGRAYSDE